MASFVHVARPFVLWVIESPNCTAASVRDMKKKRSVKVAGLRA